MRVRNSKPADAFGESCLKICSGPDPGVFFCFLFLFVREGRPQFGIIVLRWLCIGSVIVILQPPC